MTKITVFGQEESKKEEKKAIEFVAYISGSDPRGTNNRPKDFDNVCLLGKDTEMDIIMAWNDHWGEIKFIYLGHWNDGIVEE